MKTEPHTCLTRIDRTSMRRLRILSAYLGVNQPEAIAVALGDSLAARNIPLPENESPKKRKSRRNPDDTTEQAADPAPTGV